MMKFKGDKRTKYVSQDEKLGIEAAIKEATDYWKLPKEKRGKVVAQTEEGEKQFPLGLNVGMRTIIQWRIERVLGRLMPFEDLQEITSKGITQQYAFVVVAADKWPDNDWRYWARKLYRESPYFKGKSRTEKINRQIFDYVRGPFKSGKQFKVVLPAHMKRPYTYGKASLVWKFSTLDGANNAIAALRSQIRKELEKAL